MCELSFFAQYSIRVLVQLIGLDQFLIFAYVLLLVLVAKEICKLLSITTELVIEFGHSVCPISFVS